MPDVLIVAHGSRNPGWTAAVSRWFAEVRERVRPVATLSLSYLEISSPLYEDKLMDLAEGDGELLVLPFFLTRSGHGGEDVPEIATEKLTGRRSWRLLETTGWSVALGRNAARRLRAKNVSPEVPLVVCGYGASHGDGDWLHLVAEMQTAAGEFSDATAWKWASCGHFLEDHGAPLRDALASLRPAGEKRVAILPLFLAYSTYQKTLIPGVLAEFDDMEFVYTDDSILPDEAIVDWAAHHIADAVAPPAERQQNDDREVVK